MIPRPIGDIRTGRSDREPLILSGQRSSCDKLIRRGPSWAREAEDELAFGGPAEATGPDQPPDREIRRKAVIQKMELNGFPV